jgi:hypothetical protein
MRFLSLALALALIAPLHSQAPAPAQQPSPRETATSIQDGFRLAAVGDVIIGRPISRNRDAGFTSVASLLREADATFGNFEGSAFDIRQFKG